MLYQIMILIGIFSAGIYATTAGKRYGVDSTDIIIEFFRGDGYRGMWFYLSTSQIISIVIIISTLFEMARHTKKQKRQCF